MENASKALIIAGAILVSILLITAGVAIFQAINPMQDAAASQGDTMAIDTFNAQFTSFEGENKPAAEIRSLISKVISSNASSEHKITVTAPKSTTDATAKDYSGDDISSSFVSANGRYDVTFSYSGGYINKVTITK